MTTNEQQYLILLKTILENGEERKDRTGTGTLSIFGSQTRYDLRKGFPLLTTKKIHWPAVVHELLWFIKGDTNTKYLTDNGVRIWNEWADEEGNLGRVYGHQWRNFGRCVDQLTEVIDGIKKDPYGRRHIVTAWNPCDIHYQALPPCHCFFQFFVSGDGSLDVQMYQRSADMFLGVPFNIASYSLLLLMVAQECGLKARYFIHTTGDTHIYLNHIDQCSLQLSREMLVPPTVHIAKKQFFDICFEDITLEGYSHGGTIKAEVSI